MNQDSEAIAAELKAQYRDVRMLPDGSIAALHDLIFTRAILLDCDRVGYASRFCFENRSLADQRFAELSSADDHPEGSIAQRGKPR